jgi:hypothetical protein
MFHNIAGLASLSCLHVRHHTLVNAFKTSERSYFKEIVLKMQ